MPPPNASGPSALLEKQDELLAGMFDVPFEQSASLSRLAEAAQADEFLVFRFGPLYRGLADGELHPGVAIRLPQ